MVDVDMVSSSLVASRRSFATCLPTDFAASGLAAVSTIYMPQTRRLFRVVGWVVTGLCLIVLILAVAIRVDQYLLRRNAERLLVDLKSLEMRKSTYRDARLVIDRWSEEMHQDGPCQPYLCDARISVGDFFVRHRELFANHQRLAYGLGYVYRLLGGRPAIIDG